MNSKDYYLSQEELQLSSNASIMLMKNGLITKVVNTFSIISEEMQHAYKELAGYSEGIVIQNPKIARGEQYRGLPYVMLDYPREFSKKNVFAIRTMWWWGNDFSISLHLKGEYHHAATENLLKNYESLSDLYISTSDDEWDHHIKGNGYLPIKEISKDKFENKLYHDHFLRIAQPLPLHDWNKADEIIPAHFKKILAMLY